MKRFDRVVQILEEAVNGDTIGAHGNFWRGITLDQFKAKKVFGRALLVVGNPDDSNLIKRARRPRSLRLGRRDGGGRLPPDAGRPAGCCTRAHRLHPPVDRGRVPRRGGDTYR